MDVDKHAPFTKSPLDAYRGSGRHARVKYIHTCPACALGKPIPEDKKPEFNKMLNAFITFAGCNNALPPGASAGNK